MLSCLQLFKVKLSQKKVERAVDTVSLYSQIVDYLITIYITHNIYGYKTQESKFTPRLPFLRSGVNLIPNFSPVFVECIFALTNNTFTKFQNVNFETVFISAF